MDTISVETAVQTAIVVGVFALINAWFSHRAKIKDQALEWARQDELTARTEKQSKELLATQDTIVRETKKANETAKLSMGKLETVEELGRVTHALVNSDKTATMKDNRDQLEVTLVLMNEIVSLKEAQNIKPTDATKNAIEALETRISTLKSNIDDRLKQQAAAEDLLILRRMGVSTSGEIPVTKTKE